jgi:solute carrier family 25 carnitine/acylcarnitine transporter 20/29
MTATTTPPLHDVLAGGVAGSAGIIIGHPLDSMKVRLQTAAASSSCVTATASSFSSSSPMMMMLARQGGRHHSQHALQQQQPQKWVGKHTHSLWAGIGPPLVMASIVNASVFVTYGTTTRLWDEYNDSSNQNSIPATTATSSLTRNAICGGIAGIASSIIVCPVDLVKTKLQTASGRSSISSSSTSSSFSSSFSSYQTTKEIYTNYGIRGLYRGLLTTVYRQFPSFVIYFGSYDVIKTTLLQHQQQLQQQNLLASIIAGGIAGSLSWAIIYPIDLIKTRIQSLPPPTTATTLTGCSSGGAATSYYHLIKTEHIMIQSITTSIISQHGWKALYSGFGITILRAFPVNAVIFPTYEVALATLQHIL